MQKFLQRIRSAYLDILRKKVIHLSYMRGEVIPVTAIDSSGLSSSYASSYYTWRIGATWRSYLKTSVAVDTDKQVITGVRISRNFSHDIVHARILLGGVTIPAYLEIGSVGSGQRVRGKASPPPNLGEAGETEALVGQRNSADTIPISQAAEISDSSSYRYADRDR